MSKAARAACQRRRRSREAACLPNAGNIILVANQGLGKTMIAKNIAYQAAIGGHAVRFVSSSQQAPVQCPSGLLGRQIEEPVSDLVDHEELERAPSYDNRNADLLFQIVSRRYEKRSLVLTTNLAFKDSVSPKPPPKSVITPSQLAGFESAR